MRTRSTFTSMDWATRTKIDTYYDNPRFQPSLGRDGGYTGSYSRKMTTSSIDDSPIGRGYKQCNHSTTSISVDNRDVNFQLRRFNSYVGWETYDITIIDAPGWSPEQPRPAAGLSADLLDDALASSVPSLVPETSLVNFLIELRDFKSMFNIFDKRHGVLTNLNNGYLNWNFGWKPFMSDLKNIYNALTNVKKHFDFLQDQAQEPIDYMGRAVSTASSSGVEGTTNIVRSNFSLQAQWTYESTTTRTVTTQRHLKFLPIAVDIETMTRAYMQALGVCLDPSIIWNALPFSFVADWFIPIGNMLEDFRIDTYAPCYKDLSLGASVKTKTVTQFSVENCPVTTVTGTEYQRSTEMPWLQTTVQDEYSKKNTLLSDFSWPSAKQIRLGASLLYSQFFD